jgi:hypothetical protein
MDPDLNEAYIDKNYLNAEEINVDMQYKECAAVQGFFSSVEDFGVFDSLDIEEDEE